jgi:hypothetical protein
MSDSKMIDWLEKMSTLHQQVEILYVVDGYLVTISSDNDVYSEKLYHGTTVREALKKAMEENQ